jgi:6-phosphogluconolactonase
LSEALESRSFASLVVSGGRSPVAFLERLSECELEWRRVVVGLVDERWVPADSQDSNEGLVRRHLLRGKAQRARLVPLAGDEASPEEGLAAAERRISCLPAPFDVLVLGMGADGHTASWFPDAPETPTAMDPRTSHRLAVVHPRSAPHARITLTLPAVLSSRWIALQVQGEEKVKVLGRVAASADAGRWPIAAILSQSEVPLDIYYTRTVPGLAGH